MQEEFIIPCTAFTTSTQDRPTGADWSIWAFTDLDWHLLRGLPAGGWLRRYSGDWADRFDAETLLAECQWAEEWCNEVD